MNINMDKAYKDEWTNNSVINNNNDKFTTPYPGSGGVLIINGKWVATKYASEIQDAVMSKDRIRFFLDKYKSKSEDDYNGIYWIGLRQACNILTDTENITKYLNGWLNTGR